jgi:hypothetical protein|tara:strand:- start:48 stop:683 length:636 start_codon:yes stop_codon:yes gene_type:complete
MGKAEQAARAMWITVLVEAFGRKASNPQLAGYELALSDIPPETVRMAVEKWLRQSEDHPASPGRLRELCGVTSAEDRALLAWSAVLRAVPIGSYKSIDFDDRVINAVIRSMGGWVALLARCGDDFDVWARRTFIETYAAYHRTGVNGEACWALPGLSETGEHEMRHIDGTRSIITLPGPVEFVTGLPALPDVRQQRIENQKQTPLVELKKP